jgi:SAM-dependent methyltransferase
VQLPDSLKNTLQSLWDATNEDYRRKLLAALPRGDDLRLLDVGCHDGAFTQELAEEMGTSPENVAGIEIVEDFRVLAEQRGFDVRAGDLEQRWPFDDESFDVVHANQVIEHVKRLDHFVSEARRVLVPGGRAVICTENLASWHNIAALMVGFVPFSATNVSAKGPVGNPYALHLGEAWGECEPSQHIHVLTMVGLRIIFEMHGFSIERQFASGYHPLSGRFASSVSQRFPKHAHFIGVVARRGQPAP